MNTQHNQTPTTSRNALEELIGTYCEVETGELSHLSSFARIAHTHPPDVALINSFRRELSCAINNPGFVTPALYKQWTGSDEFLRAANATENQSNLQSHLEDIWDACFGHGGTTILIKEWLAYYLKSSGQGLTTLAQSCRNAKSGPPLERVEFFKGELRYALDHPGFITPALFESWTSQSVPDQTTVQQRLQEVWDQCFG